MIEKTPTTPVLKGSSQTFNILREIWKELLQIDTITPEDNFFDLGGNSFLALSLISSVSSKLGVDLSFKVLFRWPTLGALSHAIAFREEGSGAPLSISRPSDLYEITPAQEYWVNPRIDSEYKKKNKHFGAYLPTYEIAGPLDYESLQKAAAWLVVRHESLRSIFPPRNDVYYMKVLDADLPCFLPQYRDDTDGYSLDSQPTEDFVIFRHHRFDPEHGPLFLLRVCRIGDEKYILSIKIHHSIYDRWSFNVLIRDLVRALRAFHDGEEPDVIPLKYQFRDYLSMMNANVRMNREIQRQYWEKKLPSLPGELMIPGAEPTTTDPDQKICRSATFPLPDALVRKMRSSAKEYGVNLFVFLQAVFRGYLSYITGQTELIISTTILGRDFPDCENQIGGYSKVVVILTLFETGDSLQDWVDKTKKANEDMYNLQAFTLMDWIEELARPEKIFGKFWKIGYEFQDIEEDYTGAFETNQTLTQMNLLCTPRKAQVVEYTIHFDMIVRFHHSTTGLEMLVHYDSSTWSEKRIGVFMENLFHFLDKIM